MVAALLILISVIIGVITWWYMTFFKWNRHLSVFPGPIPVPVIGNAHKFGSVTGFLPATMKFRNEFGNTYKIWLGFRPRLIVSDHKFLEFLLSSTIYLDKSYEYFYSKSWLGSGLLTSSGEKWKNRRKLITPTFHFQILEQFIDIFDSQSSILVGNLKKKVEQEPFDIFPQIALCALDIICEAAMRTSVNAQTHSDSEYVKSLMEMLRIIMVRALSPIKMWNFLYLFTEDYQIEKKSLNVLHNYTKSVIKNRKEQLARSKCSVSNDDSGVKKRIAFLDLLLQCRVDGQPLPDESIREEVDTFMFAGHDTTTSGISFTLYCLSKYPEIQEKVIEELRHIFSDNKHRSATYTDLQNMKYLDMVIKESMRLYPPVPIYCRELDQDAQFGNAILPKGLVITVCPYVLHRRDDVFPDPEKFDPERFSSKNSAGRNAYAYLPFSAGPRNCIGQKFGMLKMKSIISKLLRHFEMLDVPGHKPILSSEVILKSANGLQMGLRNRSF